MSDLSVPRPPRRLWTASPDWAWGGFGVTLATASASFASYMIMTAPAEVTGYGSRDFGIFAAFDRRVPQAPAAQHPAPSAPTSTRVADLVPPADRPVALGVDDTPTGTLPAEVSRAERASGPLGDFHLRDVFGDHALIEHRSTLSLVRPGSTLAGAGEVLAIERQGRGWVVRTASGVIGGL